MQSRNVTKFALNVLFIISVVINASCKEKSDCVVPECGASISNGTSISVTKGVSGGGGTQISPDSIDAASITSTSAVVKNQIKKIGQCHEVIGYGHTWSSANASPRIGVDWFVDYQNNVNFNDEVVTLMSDLTPDTKYFVRSWIAIEKQNCDRERIVFYNDDISEFTTLP